MRKLIESVFVTLDGTIGQPQLWGMDYWDDEHHDYAGKLLLGADALLSGRVTFEAFAEAWPQRAGSGDPYADRINALPKYVASRTLTGELPWNGRLLEGDAAAAVAELKQQPGENILKFGTGELDVTLLEKKLVDEYHVWIFPVVSGDDSERFGAGLGRTHLKLVDRTVFGSGIIVAVYAPQ